MFGPFDDLFDLNGDGHLDSFEKGLEVGFLYEEVFKEDRSGDDFDTDDFDEDDFDRDDFDRDDFDSDDFDGDDFDANDF